MTHIENWENGKEKYTLNNGFMLIKADEADYGIHYAIYSGLDEEFSYSWNYLSHYSDGDDCERYWIMKNNQRLGGIVIEPNYLSHFFLEPPYTVDAFDIMKEIDNALMTWSDKNEKIFIYDANQMHVENFTKLGYRHKFARMDMIRPTEKFDDIDFGENYIIKSPTMEDSAAIGKVLYESYKGGIQYEEFSNNTEEDEVEICQLFLQRYIDTNSLHASTLVYDKNTNELVAVCLAGKYNEYEFDISKINDVAVLPNYRRQGLAEKLIKRSLTILKDISPATKLDVSVGNPSESLYYKLGFLGAPKLNCLYKKM